MKLLARACTPCMQLNPGSSSGVYLITFYMRTLLTHDGEIKACRRGEGPRRRKEIPLTKLPNTARVPCQP